MIAFCIIELVLLTILTVINFFHMALLVQFYAKFEEVFTPRPSKMQPKTRTGA